MFLLINKTENSGYTTERNYEGLTTFSVLVEIIVYKVLCSKRRNFHFEKCFD